MAVAGVLLALAKPASTTSPTGYWSAADTSKPPPKRDDLGCGETPTLDGRADSSKQFLCGTNGPDVIRAGANDVVRGFDGADKIYAQNNAPNDIDGGPGSDTAWVDPRWDTYRYVRALSAVRPRTHAETTPSGFDYSLPDVICDVDDTTHQKVIKLELPTGQRIMMAAKNANPGIVDWQYVAWAQVIMKYDWTAKVWNVYNQSEWLWDRTYDLGEFKRHIPNEWHSFDAATDDETVDVQPFTISEPGDYTVKFLLYWYSEAAAATQTQTLQGLPGLSASRYATEYHGKYVRDSLSTATGRRWYCRFP